MDKVKLRQASVSWVTTSEVRAHALRAGISSDMLASYRKAGLVARAEGRRSPARALRQLDGIVAARRWTRSLDRFRHALWWSGVPVEEFGQLRQQWTRYADHMAAFMEYVAGLSESGRDAEAQALSEVLASDRRFPFPRRRITAQADRESFADLMVGLVARDPQTVIFDDEWADLAKADPEGRLLLDAIRKGLARALDDDQPMTIGELIGAGFRADEFPEAGLWMTVVCCGWMPEAESVYDVVATMDEERAKSVRDFIRHWIPEPRVGVDLERSPEVAVMLIVMCDRMMSAMPELVELVPKALPSDLRPRCPVRGAAGQGPSQGCG